MLMAHLRGLLKPDYDNGVNSIIREELVLQAVSQECEGKGLLTQATMTASMLGVVDDKMRARTVRQAVDNLRMGTSLLRMEPYDKILRQVKAHSVDANIAAFKLLEKTDVFEILKQNLEKNQPNATTVQSTKSVR